MVAALLCYMWAMLAALGLSNLRYSEAGSSRNIIIVGLSLFFALSIPAYFQQYGISPNSNSSVPSYFQPYIVASHGPFRSKYGGVSISWPALLAKFCFCFFVNLSSQCFRNWTFCHGNPDGKVIIKVFRNRCGNSNRKTLFLGREHSAALE